jgi:hypothetical protein
MRERHARAGDLTERVDTGIRATGAVHDHGRAFEPCERRFEETLDRFALLPDAAIRRIAFRHRRW